MPMKRKTKKVPKRKPSVDLLPTRKNPRDMTREFTTGADVRSTDRARGGYPFSNVDKFRANPPAQFQPQQSPSSLLDVQRITSLEARLKKQEDLQYLRQIQLETLAQYQEKQNPYKHADTTRMEPTPHPKMTSLSGELVREARQHLTTSGIQSILIEDIKEQDRPFGEVFSSASGESTSTPSRNELNIVSPAELPRLPTIPEIGRRFEDVSMENLLPPRDPIPVNPPPDNLIDQLMIERDEKQPLREDDLFAIQPPVLVPPQVDHRPSQPAISNRNSLQDAEDAADSAYIDFTDYYRQHRFRPH